MNDWQQEPPEYKPPEGANIHMGPAPVTPPPASQPPSEFAGLPVRAKGDKIFILKEAKKHWVTSPDAYSRLGFKLGDEAIIDEATLVIIPEGEPIK